MQSTAFIVRLSDILVQNLSIFSAVLRIPPSIIGLSFLAIGNSIGELVTNTFVANQVSVTAGITACYGGPIMSMFEFSIINNLY